ncbi:YidC/Oxa1 family membrane protein insertase [Catenulispora sp. GP43]|uniref:YidC/Oxa1 family membrane protein insertase n=1 Tax=Catenulispora sp. GP43 TaxID=3156263 RepID=UPI003512C078
MSLYTLLTPAIVAAYHAVTGLSLMLVPVLGGLGPAAAIVMFTAAVRLCLHPLNRAQMTAQLAAQKQRAALAPAVAKLQRKYKNDPLRVQRETVELYRANGVKLVPGIGLGLVQIPVFIVVYRLFVAPTIGGHRNALLGDRLFGVGLGSHLRDAFSGAGSSVVLGHVAVFAVLIAALAVLATWSSRRMRNSATTDAAPKFMTLMPYFSVLGAVVLPLASSLYVATTTLWTLVERRRLVAPAQS